MFKIKVNDSITSISFFGDEMGTSTHTTIGLYDIIHYHLHKKRFLSTPSHKSTPSRTWDAISGGMIGEGSPSIRSSPTRIVSSMFGCESTEAR